MTPQDRRLRVVVTGFRPSIRDLCDALGRQPGIDLVGAAGRVNEAAWAFNGFSIDVVVHATPPGPLPKTDLTEIRHYTSAPIVLLAEGAAPSLFEDALEADVADVIALPEPAEHVAFAVRKAGRAAAASTDEQRALVITSFSPKGGTGKTVIATNLAATLGKDIGARTLLVDLDLQFGDAAIMLGVEPEQTLRDLATAPGELDAEKVAGYMTRHGASGIDLLPAPLRPEDADLVTEQKVERLLDVAGPAYQAIVVDTSPSFHGPMLTALDRTDVLLLVCTPEVPTMKNVRLGIETLRKLSFPEDRIRLVLNRADAAGGIGRAEVEGALGMSVSYELPTTLEAPAALNEGRPLVLSSAGSAFATSIGAMSASLVDAGTGAEVAHGTRQRGGLARAVRDLASGWRHARAEGAAATSGEAAP